MGLSLLWRVEVKLIALGRTSLGQGDGGLQGGTIL